MHTINVQIAVAEYCTDDLRIVRAPVTTFVNSLEHLLFDLTHD